MGRTALLGLLTLAAAGAAGAPAPGAGAPAPGPAATPVSDFEPDLSAGRRAQSELVRLFDELEVLRRSYLWERDDRRARSRRDDILGRITPTLKTLADSHETVTRTMHRYAEEQGLQALEVLATKNKEASPALREAMRAQTFSAQASVFLRGAQDQLRREEGDWASFEGRAQERRSLRRIVWALSLTLLAVLGAVAYGFVAALRRRRRRGRDVITVRPE